MRIHDIINAHVGTTDLHWEPKTLSKPNKNHKKFWKGGLIVGLHNVVLCLLM